LPLPFASAGSSLAARASDGVFDPLLVSSVEARNRVSSFVFGPTSTTTRVSPDWGSPLVATELDPRLACSRVESPGLFELAWSRTQSRQTAAVLIVRRWVGDCPFSFLAASESG